MRNLLLSALFLLSQSCGNTLGTGPTLRTTTGPEITSENTLSDDFANGLSSWECYDSDNFDMDANGNTSDDCSSNFTTNAGQLKVRARGADVWGNTHQFTSLYRTGMSGDFDININIVSQDTAPNPWSKLGLFVANDITSLYQGGYAGCFSTTANRVAFQYAAADNGIINTSSSSGTNAKPVYLRLTKVGSTLNCYFKYSFAAPWIQHGDTDLNTLSFNATFDFGIITTSHSNGGTLEITMDNFVVD